MTQKVQIKSTDPNSRNIVIEKWEGGQVSCSRSAGVCLTLAKDITSCIPSEPLNPPQVKMDMIVDPVLYLKICRKKPLRIRAAAVQSKLTKEYQNHKANAKTFKILETLQIEQGNQMESLIERGTKEEMALLVETHTTQLAVAQEAADADASHMVQKQRHEFQRMLVSLSSGTPSRTVLDDSQQTSQQQASPSGSMFGFGQVGKKVGKFGMNFVTGGLQRAGILASNDDDSLPSTTGEEEALRDIDISTYTINLIKITVIPKGLLRVRIPLEVKVLNIKSALSLLSYTESGNQDLERSAGMFRISCDELGQWIVPISVTDLRRASMLRSKTRNWSLDLTKDIITLMPQHIVNCAISESAELLFPSLVDSLQSAVLLNGPDIHAGTILCTQHSNMSWCNLLSIFLFDPNDSDANLESTVEQVVSLGNRSTQVFVDTSRLSSSHVVGRLTEVILQEVARSTYVASKKRWPTMPEEDDIHQVVSVVLTPSHLSSAMDLDKGMLSSFNPVSQQGGTASPAPSPASQK